MREVDMEENKNETPETEGTVETDATPSEADAAKTALAEALAENARLAAELAESHDKYLRMYAEYENYRKRTAKEREGVYTEAVIH